MASANPTKCPTRFLLILLVEGRTAELQLSLRARGEISESGGDRQHITFHVAMLHELKHLFRHGP
jgi:hypothetical protein